MTFQSKRAWRLQEFAAHGGNVNCLALGPKKARLMATGGEDRKVSPDYAILFFPLTRLPKVSLNSLTFRI